LLKRINKNHIIYGIQGGKGSFNYQAALSYLKKNQVKHFKIKYLYTSEKVLSSLWQGTLDYGFLAINNNLAGVVDESIRAISRYKSKIIDRFSMEVKHFLMKRKDIDIKKITTIITHPQVIKQCQKTLANRYSNYRLLSGQGDLINTSGAAGALADEKLPKNYAVLGPKELSEIYNLEIIDANFQDDVSFTTFLLVSR
jgi:prephenate dehydratase